MVSEQITNGGFETIGSWWTGSASYTTQYAHTGIRSAFLYQQYFQTPDLNIPVDADTLLTYWVYTAGGTSGGWVIVHYTDTSEGSFTIGKYSSWTQITGSLQLGKTVQYIKLQGSTGNPYWLDDISFSGSLAIVGPGLYDLDGNMLLSGSFFTRVLETRTAKYSAHQFPSINKEYLQSLGLKNRLFLIEALGTGSASAPTDRTIAENSAILTPGQEGFILTRLMSDLLPVTFLNAEPVDTGGRPAELKIVIHAVERITGSA